MKTKLYLFSLLAVVGLIVACGKDDPKPKPAPEPEPEKPVDPTPTPTPGPEGPTLKVISFNIRYSGADDGANMWANRKNGCAKMINSLEPDIFGLQECENDQFEFMKSNCRDYTAIGVGRDDGQKAGEYSAIYYNKSRITCTEWGTKWLSATPDTPSQCWSSSHNRILTWSKMKDTKTGVEFCFFNTHFDLDVTAHAECAKLARKLVDEITPEGWPKILVGDLNALEDYEDMACLYEIMDCAQKNATITTNASTFHGYGDLFQKYPQYVNDYCIDHILWSGLKSCYKFEVIKNAYGTNYLSDHYPVMATFEIQ